jgi:hypothetical protein
MRVLVSVILVIFGLAAMIGSGAELFSADGERGPGAMASHILSGLMGAGLMIAGPGIGRRLAWARLYALVNLVGMAALSIVSTVRLYGEIRSVQHATRAVLAILLFLVILRMERRAGE